MSKISVAGLPAAHSAVVGAANLLAGVVCCVESNNSKGE
jgi:hypothetical protein